MAQPFIEREYRISAPLLGACTERHLRVRGRDLNGQSGRASRLNRPIGYGSPRLVLRLGHDGRGQGGALSSADFDEVMVRSRAALDQIAKGKTDGYKALYSVGEDITLGNPFGGFGRGSAAVYEQLERAASHYRDGEATGFETVSQFVGAGVAYTVEIERFNAKVGGQRETSDVALRVTCVYRREDDGWKLVHRHADPRVARQAAESVLQD
jgi:ketosteroid isomerase-like protein